MITIQNIQKLGNSIKYPMTTLTHHTHYEFKISYNDIDLQITLGRFRPLVQNGTPHPNKGHYLLLCQNEMIWFTKDELKDMDNVLNGIYQIMYKLC